MNTQRGKTINSVIISPYLFSLNNKYKIFSVILTFLYIAIFLINVKVVRSTINSLTAEGNVYFVAKDGNDENTGTQVVPCLTIQHNAETLIVRDTVLVREGTYHESVFIGQGGIREITLSC